MTVHAQKVWFVRGELMTGGPFMQNPLEQLSRPKRNHSWVITALAAVVPLAFAAMATPAPAGAQEKMATPAPAATQGSKPNILFIMGDDIGLMQPSIYHRGWMVGETPNIDRIGNEGGIFMDYVAMQRCTAGRNAFFTGMYPLRTGMIPPQLPGSPSWLRPGTPALAVFLRALGYATGEIGRNRLEDT